MKKGGARKSAMKKGGARRPSARKSGGARKQGASRARSAVARVTRVAKEVAQQASGAVTSGVETLREMGESFVERVRED